jgi:hypothetical protein
MEHGPSMEADRRSVGQESVNLYYLCHRRHRILSLDHSLRNLVQFLTICLNTLKFVLILRLSSRMISFIK